MFQRQALSLLYRVLVAQKHLQMYSISKNVGKTKHINMLLDCYGNSGLFETLLSQSIMHIPLNIMADEAGNSCLIQ